MKKLIAFTCFFIGTQTSFAQTKYIDSLRTELAKTTLPGDSFSLIVKIAEYNLVLGGGAVDSAYPIHLIQIAQQLKNDSLLAISYNWIGSYIAFKTGDNTAALEYYFKAIPLAKKVNDKRRISSLYFDIGLVYNSLQNKEEAFNNVKKGGENLPDRSSPMYNFMLVQYRRGMTQYFLSSRQYDSALHYVQLLSETSNALKSLSFQYPVLYLSAEIYAEMGDKDMAEIYFKKAMAMTPLIDSKSSRMGFYGYYIPFLLKNGRVTEAHTEAIESLQLGREDNNMNVKLAAAEFLRQVFDTLHQTDSAYYYAKMKEELTASIFSQNNINRIQALAFNEQLRSIEDNAKKNEEAQQRKENIQYALIALGIITLLFLYLLLSRSFITNSKLIIFFGVIALLIVFEFLNLLLHPFLERITNHSPLFTLLAMVCIAALLVPLHHRAEKWATEKLVEKNKKIRLAAAKKTIEELDTGSTDK